LSYALPSTRGFEFGLIALRARNVARTIVAIGTLSLVFIYVAPIVGALATAGVPRRHALTSLTLPTLRFPEFSTHSAGATRTAVRSAPAHFLQRIGGSRHARGAAAAATKAARHPKVPLTGHSVRVPVVNS